MFDFFGHSYKLPPLSRFSLDSYLVDFSLDQLVPGIDNIRCDVYLSPTFISATRKIASSLVTRHAGLEKSDASNKQQAGWAKEIETYKQLYRELMRDALNKAKAQRQIQIEYLAQAAAIKVLLAETRSQFESLMGRMKKMVRQTEHQEDPAEAQLLKGRLQRMLQERDAIQQRVGLEIFGFWSEVEKKEIQDMRDAIFGNRATVFQDLLPNVLLHLDQPDNDYYLLSEYDIVLGRRIEDPDKYRSLLYLLRFLLSFIDSRGGRTQVIVERRLKLPDQSEEEAGQSEVETYQRRIDALLQAPQNMDRLFDWLTTKAEYKSLKKQKADSARLEQLSSGITLQKQVLHFFYRQFCRTGLMDRIAATYEMQPEYAHFCPPLVPQQIVQYLIQPRTRRIVKARLKRMQSVYGRSFPLRALNRKIKSLEQMTTSKRKSYLLRFMKAFARYHRDRTNLGLIRDAMERVNIAVEDKVLALSRENNTLYEFLLPHEHTEEKAPIINHVVIKADVRGSTDITFRMSERGLNPASYFSLNFFDPISAILSDYEATKVFIEGDALILSIFERENRPEGWYGVARACGLALNMLLIIQRCNRNSIKFRLPVLELGIGISFISQPPAFLFDGGSRIMISPAINQADRLSSCSKIGRRMLDGKKSPFNLYVFQTSSGPAINGSADDAYLRYNVNGIELNPEGFEKLGNEIDLKLLQGDFSDRYDQKINLYSGKFPTKSGRYQRLVVRESQIPVLHPETLEPLRITSRKYFEVCTHPKLYALARR